MVYLSVVVVGASDSLATNGMGINGRFNAVYTSLATGATLKPKV